MSGSGPCAILTSLIEVKSLRPGMVHNSRDAYFPSREGIRRGFRVKYLVSFFLLILFATPAFCAPAISCHCFQDRSFDTMRPAAVDEYLLATTQNSFMAAAFGFPKKNLVRAKMSGSSGDRLWVAHYVASLTNHTAEDLQAARSDASSWSEAFDGLGIEPSSFGSAFVAALSVKTPEAGLAVAAANETLVSRFGATEGEVEKLRRQGASTAETVLSLFLSKQGKSSAADYYNEVWSGGASWGTLLFRAGLQPAEVGDAIGSMLR